MKKDLLFYDAYEDFYEMAAGSRAFESFCRDAFGEDFSQDKFIEEGLENWYNLLIMQTDYINQGYEKFYENLARYIYVARK